MPMTAASMFWLDTLHGCNLDRSLSLPYNRYRLSDEHRTGRGISVSFDFGKDLSHDFLACVSSNNIQPQHLVLACYYVFLFKLTNGERDLCIGMNTHGRYREELISVVGMFVNAIPLRCQLDPHWSFHQLVEYVQEMMTDSLEYSYFPLQRILAQHPKTSKPAFLDTSFAFSSTENESTENEVIIGGSRLHSMPISIKISENEIMSKFDFALTIHYNQSINQLSCAIDASLDLFNRTTFDKIAQRFESMLEQLFKRTDVQMNKSIYELSLILPDERLLMQSMNNTQVLLPSMSCIHHEFVCQAMKHQQKLAVELDDQSLTYSELLYYVQVLASNLLNKQKVLPGDVICQCVERSLSMVSSVQKSFFFIIKFFSSLGNRNDGNPDGWWCLLSIITSRSTTAFICTRKTNSKSSCSCSSFDKSYIY
jgi:non-ribosomal peptide synthetase component F